MKSDTLKSDTTFGYFPVNERAIANGFYLTGAGMENIGTYQPYPIATHPEMYQFSWDLGRILPEYQLVFIFAGSGEFESQATGLVRLQAGAALFLLPDVWHRYRPNPATGWSDYWISFNGNIPHIWQQAGMLTPLLTVRNIQRPSHLSTVLKQIVSHAVELGDHSESASYSALAVIAQLFAGDARPLLPTMAPSTTPSIHHTKGVLVRRALDIIWNHSHRNLSATLIAAQLGVTRRTLERHFKIENQRSVLAELTACRMLRARQMLTNTHLPIKRIARAAGFSSPTHLTTTFRRELKTTPRQVRGGR